MYLDSLKLCSIVAQANVLYSRSMLSLDCFKNKQSNVTYQVVCVNCVYCFVFWDNSARGRVYSLLLQLQQYKASFSSLLNPITTFDFHDKLCPKSSQQGPHSDL